MAPRRRSLTVSPRFARLAALALAALGSCAEAPRAGAILHLDPTLADGRSSAEALANTRTVIAAWSIAGVDTDLAPWRLEDFVKFPARAAAPGIHVGDVEREPGVFPRIRLVWEGEIAAREFDVLELDLLKYHTGNVRISWTRSDDPPDVERDPHVLHVVIEKSDAHRATPFALSSSPEWKGVVRRITVVPASFGPQRFELSGMRFVAEGFRMGADPLAAELAPRPAHDGGLVARGNELRRTWPSDWNVPLLASCRVPRDAQLVVDTAIPDVLAAYPGRLHFAVDARVVDEKWLQLAERALAPSTNADPTAWEPLIADLSRYAGREIELRLRAFADESGATATLSELADLDADERRLAFHRRDPRNIGLGGDLLRARALWGAPRVLGSAPERPPDVVLVTVDSLRADRSTPFLAALAARGTTFANASSPASACLAAHASLLSGLDIDDHGVSDDFRLLPAQVTTLAERLRERGYETAAAVSAPHLEPAHSGLGQGFDRFLACGEGAWVNGGDTLSAVQAWLAEWRSLGDRPLFLWVHFFDPHAPYKSPLPWQAEWEARSGRARPPAAAPVREFPESVHTRKGEFLWEVQSLAHARWQYDAAVAYADLLVEELCTSLEQAGVLPGGALFVTADHGESLGEDGRFFEHRAASAEVRHVPLITVVPGERAGTVHADATSTLELVRRIERLAGLEPLAPTELVREPLPLRPVDHAERTFLERAGIDLAPLLPEILHEKGE